MPLSMALLRSETLEHLGIDDVDLDPGGGTTNLDLLINRSWWDILDRFEFKEKEKTDTFSTVASTRDYDIQTIIGSDIFDAIRTLSVLNDDDDSHNELSPMDIHWYEQNYNEQSSLEAMPERWMHLGGNLRLYPTPDAVYTITLYYKYILNDLTAGNPAIPQSWHESIMYGAVARGHIRARDYNSANFMQSKANKAMADRATTDAKEERSMIDIGVSVRRNPYNVRH